jgi:hypothetical protein
MHENLAFSFSRMHGRQHDSQHDPQQAGAAQQAGAGAAQAAGAAQQAGAAHSQPQPHPQFRQESLAFSRSKMHGWQQGSQHDFSQQQAAGAAQQAGAAQPQSALAYEAMPKAMIAAKAIADRTIRRFMETLLVRKDPVGSTRNLA